MSLTIKRATKTVPLCLNLDLKAEHERATKALDDAKTAAAADPRETGHPEVLAAAEAVKALEQQMAEHTIVFTLQAARRKDWTEFELSHPPRPGVEDDKTYSIDISALDEIIAPSIASVESPTGDPVPFSAADDWMDLADEMSNSQWEAFALAIFGLNRGSTTAPFSPAASLTILRSAATSKRQSD